MNLSSKRCIACNSDSEPLSNDIINEYLQDADQWHSKDNKSICRSFKFKNFQNAIDFVNKIGVIAENENHHPDIEFGWGYCNITLQTHSIGGLHENDFIVAAKIDEL